MDNIFTRNISLLGQENFEQIQNKKVAVIGLGGVGGYAVEALIRLGVQDIVICDKDTVDITNVNRQIIATNSSVGEKKTSAFLGRILSINPNCKVTEYYEFLDESNVDKIISGCDFVVDAIDSLESKIVIYKACINKGIEFVSSMGMANKIDPSKVKILRLDKTENDKLAKKIRLMCRNQEIDLKKVNVVFSDELPFSVFKEHLPSIVLVPATAGIQCASCFLKTIINKK